MNIYKGLLFCVALMLGFAVKGQDLAADSVGATRVQLNLGGGVFSWPYGPSIAHYGVTPKFEYQVTERFKFKAGFSVMESMSMDGYRLRGREPRSLAPRRRGATAVGLYAAGEYKVNDRLWIGGLVFHLGGEMVLPWCGFGGAESVRVSGFTADARYRIGEKSFIDVHFLYLKDETGLLAPFLLNPYMGSACFGPTTYGLTGYGLTGYGPYLW